MSKEKRPDESSQAEVNRKKKKTDSGMAGYIKNIIPSKAIIDFIYKEDFDGDGSVEAIVGYTEMIPFPPATSVVWLKAEGGELMHAMLMPDIGGMDSNTGIFDNAAAEDTDGDGFPELILSLSAENGHYILVYVFDWLSGKPVLAWKGEEPYYHGNMEIADIDDDGVCEIITYSGTMEGKEILDLDKAGYHMRKSCFYKWDGSTYTENPYEVKMPYLSYNRAIEFLQYIWQQDYKTAYEMVLMPGFMGLDGLDDSSLSEFRKYVNKHFRPALRRNLSKGRLVPAEPYDNFCLFRGFFDDLSVELVNVKGNILIQSLNIHKKNF